MDEIGYLSEATLDAIRNWPCEDLPGLFAFLQRCWKYPDYFRCLHEDFPMRFEISTGGWSGNEELLDAFQENFAAWSLCWLSSARGGHYKFEVPELK